MGWESSQLQKYAIVKNAENCFARAATIKEVYMTTSNVLLLIVLWYEKNFFSVVVFFIAH